MTHRESDKTTVNMQVNGRYFFKLLNAFSNNCIGRSLILAKPSLSSDMYSCPASNCGMTASLGSVWAHWVTEHAQITSQPTTKRQAEPPRSYNNKKPRSSTYCPSISSSSSSKFSAAPALVSTMGLALAPTPASSPPPPAAAAAYAPASAPAHAPAPAPASGQLNQVPAVPRPRNPFARLKIPITTSLKCLNNPPSIYQFVAEGMSIFLQACPFHSMMFGDIYDGVHGLTYNCWEESVGAGSELITVYKPQFSISKRFCCYNCFSPECPAFQHETRQNCGLGMDYRSYEDWWRSGSYFIFRCQALRELVFGQLGLAVDVFDGDFVKYTKWLFEGALVNGERVKDGHLTNLVMLMYGYIVVSSDPSYKVPEKGFILGEFLYFQHFYLLMDWSGKPTLSSDTEQEGSATIQEVSSSPQEGSTTLQDAATSSQEVATSSQLSVSPAAP